MDADYIYRWVVDFQWIDSSRKEQLELGFMSISSSFLHDKAIMIEFICIMKKQVYNKVTYPQTKKVYNTVQWYWWTKNLFSSWFSVTSKYLALWSQTQMIYVFFFKCVILSIFGK